jgi:GDPmannose 4,6-dehydratase
VRIDRRYFRPAEVDTLQGDATKARTKLGWTPEVRFPELVAEMVREDYRIAQRDQLVQQHGHPVHRRGDA